MVVIVQEAFVFGDITTRLGMVTDEGLTCIVNFIQPKNDHCVGKKSSRITDDTDLYADVSFELSEQVISRSNQRYMPTFQNIMSIY